MFINKKNYIFFIGLILCLTPFVESSTALLLGIIVSLIGFNSDISKYSSKLLKISIVLMGFGMNLNQVIIASKSGFVYTAVSVISVVTIGLLLGKLFKVDKNTSLLISCGTGICGGSAIAAISSVIGAKDNEISISLIVVFVLNAIALIIFPILGHILKLDQITFGNWAAIAIHDTSSVVGAGAAYGSRALEVATTVKLIRALWIIPLSIVIALFNKNSGKIKFPWFILYFVFAILIAHYLTIGENIYPFFNMLGRKGMVVALYFIGSGISIVNMKKAGLKTFIQGTVLWFIVGIVSLFLLSKVI